MILNRSLRASRWHRKPRRMRILRSRLPCRSFKQHIEEEDFEHLPEIEAEIRVEDEKAVVLESKVETMKKSLAE